jgi:cation:H+ antiporter
VALQLLLFAVSLALLTFGAEAFIRGATAVATRLGLSAFFIGLTIVGFGTSAPEFATSVGAALQGNADLSVGNVVGSNIFNIALILGLTALICPIPVQATVVRREAPVMIAVALLPFLAMATGGSLGRPWGLACLAGLGAFLFWGYRSGKADAALPAVSELAPEVAGRGTQPWWRALALIVLGLALLVGGAQLLIQSASEIARGLGVPELIIALTVVAGGTSAPELFTSLVSAWRKQPDIAIGNIVGSNIFNVLGILGSAAVVYPQALAPQVLQFDLPVMLFASLLCIPIFLSHHRISRAEGAVLLAGYGAYLAVLIRLGGG